MTTTTAPQVTRPIAIGDSRDFEAGRHVVTVYRKTETCYRVSATTPTHHVLDWTIAEYDHTRGNLEIGMSGKRAAWIRVQQLVAEFEADAERPADLLARTAADYAAADLSRLSPAQQAALRAADSDGTIRRGNGVTVTTLKALARAHVGLLVYRTEGMRRTVTAIQLNRHGRRLADHLTTQIAA